MNWYLNIPKILHVYWGTGTLPYLRYLTVATFMKHNPDWKVILWQPKYPFKVVTWGTKELDYPTDWTDTLPELLQLPIEQKFVDFKDFGMSNDISEVHKSDYLRYWALYNYGGVWSDMDIIYFDSITQLKINVPEYSTKETFVCISSVYGHTIGFLMAAKGSVYFKKLVDVVKVDSNKYQCIGANICNIYFPTLRSVSFISPAVNIGMEAVYTYDAKSIKYIYVDKYVRKFTTGSIGLHWFAGHQLAGDFLRETNGGVINLPKNILGNLITKVTS